MYFCEKKVIFMSNPVLGLAKCMTNITDVADIFSQYIKC